MDNLDDFVSDDELAYPSLAELGWTAQPISWRDPRVDWNQFAAVIIRTPWDYQQDPAAFLAVLEGIDNSAARLFNPLNVVRWNMHKTYLRDLAQAGVRIVPTLWRSGFSEPDLAGCFADLAAETIVLKPVVGANADHTYCLRRNSKKAVIRELERVFRLRSYMVQPFMEAILTEGEYSLFFFAGEYSHAIVKRPKQGDFRVQEEHGATIRPIQTEPELIAAGQQALAAVETDLLYARVDLVRDRAGAYVLMELELIEPSLYLRMDHEAPRRFARAFEREVNRQD